MGTVAENDLSGGQVDAHLIAHCIARCIAHCIVHCIAHCIAQSTALAYMAGQAADAT